MRHTCFQKSNNFGVRHLFLNALHITPTHSVHNNINPMNISSHEPLEVSSAGNNNNPSSGTTAKTQFSATMSRTARRHAALARGGGGNNSICGGKNSSDKSKPNKYAIWLEIVQSVLLQDEFVNICNDLDWICGNLIDKLDKIFEKFYEKSKKDNYKTNYSPEIADDVDYGLKMFNVTVLSVFNTISQQSLTNYISDEMVMKIINHIIIWNFKNYEYYTTQQKLPYTIHLLLKSLSDIEKRQQLLSQIDSKIKSEINSFQENKIKDSGKTNASKQVQNNLPKNTAKDEFIALKRKYCSFLNFLDNIEFFGYDAKHWFKPILAVGDKGDSYPKSRNLKMISPFIDEFQCLTQNAGEVLYTTVTEWF